MARWRAGRKSRANKWRDCPLAQVESGFSIVRAQVALERWPGPEIEQQAYFETRRSEIVEHLRFSALRESSNGLVFDDDLVVDEHVESDAPENHAVVVDERVDLSIDLMPGFGELVLKRSGVDRLCEAKAEFVVHPEIGVPFLPRKWPKRRNGHSFFVLHSREPTYSAMDRQKQVRFPLFRPFRGKKGRTIQGADPDHGR